MSKNARKLATEIAGDEDERLQIVLYQALDQWLQAHIANLLKNISMDRNDPHAVDRALKGAQQGIKGWKNGRTMIHELFEGYDEGS